MRRRNFRCPEAPSRPLPPGMTAVRTSFLPKSLQSRLQMSKSPGTPTDSIPSRSTLDLNGGNDIRVLLNFRQGNAVTRGQGAPAVGAPVRLTVDSARCLPAAWARTLGMEQLP